MLVFTLFLFEFDYLDLPWWVLYVCFVFLLVLVLFCFLLTLGFYLVCAICVGLLCWLFGCCMVMLLV